MTVFPQRKHADNSFSKKVIHYTTGGRLVRQTSQFFPVANQKPTPVHVSFCSFWKIFHSAKQFFLRFS
jgi:hypothetical protein